MENVKKIIKSLGTKNKEIKKVEVYINDYYKYKDDINLIYIFGNMRVIKRKVSSICDFVILKGIFNKEETKGYLFKDEGTKNIIKKYLKEGNIGFREIDSKIIIINNEIENTKNSYDKVKFEIKNIIKLIKLQQGLILNGSMIIDFRSNSFKYINGVILPRDLENLVPYKSEYLCRNKDIFDDYKMITNPKGEITINEKNIVLLIKHYLDLRLSLLDKQKLNEENIMTLDSIYSEVIKNNYNGILVNKNEYNQLIKKLYELKEQQEFREFIGKNAYYTIHENYSINKYINRLEAIYNEIV